MAQRQGWSVVRGAAVAGAAAVWLAWGSAAFAQSATSAVTRSSWTSIGPGNIGGRVRALAVHPSTPSTIFAGGVNGGIWRSTNGGVTWSPLDDYLPSLAITALVMQPGTPATMYAGTGESFVQADGARGRGILKSTNGGATWIALPATDTSDFYYVNRLAMSADGTTLLAATSAGLYRSTNGGLNFTQVLQVSGLGYSEIVDVKFLTGSSTTAVASGNSQNAYRSTDGGANWTPATGLINQLTNGAAPQSVEMGVAGASAPNTVYLSININSGEVWKSTNGGASYAKVSAAGKPAHLTTFGTSANAVWVDPTNANTVVVGGDDLYRSTDGGVNWTTISAKNFQLEGLSIHAHQHAIVSDPGYNGTTNRRVFIANDGGVWKADDILQAPHSTVHPCCNTIDFVPLNGGLVIAQFFGASGSSPTGSIVGGTQGNGTVVYTPAGGVSGWTTIAGDDAGFGAVDAVDANYMYGSFAYLRLYRSTTGGTLPNSIYGPNSGGTCKAAPYRIDDACNGTANYTSPFQLDPNNSSRLLAGGLSLWRSDDVKADLTETTGPHWTAIKAPSAGSPISALTVHFGGSDVIWVGHNNGDLYATANGTAGSPSWRKVDGATLPDRTVTAIAIDPRNANVVYVGLEGFFVDNLWKTTDNGTTWSVVSGVPAIPMRSLLFDPRGSEFVFLGTDAGVFTTRDAGATWDAATVGPAATSVPQMFWMGSTLVAATHGRGMFTTTVASPVTASPSSVSFSAVRNPGAPVNLGLTPPQTVAVTYVGAGTPSWTMTADQPWVSFAGSSAGNVRVSIVNPSNVIGSSTSLSATVTVAAANVGTSVSFPVTLTVLTNGASDPLMSLDGPANGTSVPHTGFQLGGWALDRGSALGAGIDYIHVWAFPKTGSGFGAGILVGFAEPNGTRGDVASVFGSQFLLSGFNLRISNLTNGDYRLGVYAHSVVSDSFSSVRFTDISVTDPVSIGVMSLDFPANGSSVGLAFAVSGWAIDLGAESGSGIDTIHVWAFPRTSTGFGGGIFAGVGNYGGARGDVGAVFGSQFLNSAFSLQSSLPAGDYRFVVYARSTVSGAFSVMRFSDITVGSGPSPAMAVDAPGNNTSVGQPFALSGWAVDRGAASGTGVDAIHVYAFPAGSSAGTFAGAASLGGVRGDVGAAFGTQFTNSGYSLTVSGLAPGQYDIGVYAHSTVTGTFNQYRLVRVTVQ